MKSLILLLLIALVASKTNLRNLDFNYNCTKTYTIKTINVLDSKITFKEKVGVKNGKAFIKFIMISNTGTHTLGNTGDSSSFPKKITVSENLMKFNTREISFNINHITGNRWCESSTFH